MHSMQYKLQKGAGYVVDANFKSRSSKEGLSTVEARRCENRPPISSQKNNITYPEDSETQVYILKLKLVVI